MLWIFLADHTQSLRIACVGDSITAGSGAPDPERDGWVGQLSDLLGSDHTVLNYGVGGTTMASKGNAPWITTGYYNELRQNTYDLIYISLGTNDAKQINVKCYGDLVTDAMDLITLCRSRAKRVVLLLPPTIFYDDNPDAELVIHDDLIVNEVAPRLRQAAYQSQCELIDLHLLYTEDESLVADGIHPNKAGHARIASRIYEDVTQPKEAEDGFAGLSANFWHGFRIVEMEVAGRKAQVVKPWRAAVGHPFAWRGRWWDVWPQADIALLERGYHVVYVDLVELYGNPESCDICNKFYDYLKGEGLSSKVTLFGFSRGGVYVMNWAAQAVDHVSSAYLDNPVLDLKSCPAGLGRQPRIEDQYQLFLKDYGLRDADVASFTGSPIDKVEKFTFPIIICCADADDEVPPEENTLPFEKAVNAAGGHVEVIHKPGALHHPHSLANPEPLVRFLLIADGFDFSPK